MPKSTSSASLRARVLLIWGWAVVAMSGPLLEVFTIANTDQAGWHWPVGMLAFAPAAALILIRRPENRVGRTTISR